MKKLSIAYFGTPYFSALFLEKVLTDTTINQLIEVKFVVTRLDKPVGRKQEIASSPVKQIAKKYTIPVIEDLTDLQNTTLLQKCDFAFLYAYGGIIPKDLLDKSRFGFFNTHPSLLPKYRGPSPIAFPLIFGDTETGVTLIKLDEEIDHGPILIQEKISILPHDRRPDLEIKLTDLAYKIFKQLIVLVSDSRMNELTYQEQNHENAISTRMLEKKDGFIPFPTLQKVLKNEAIAQNELPQIFENSKLKIENSAKIFFNLFRGLYPWPGMWTYVNIKGAKKRLKITDVDIIRDGRQEYLVIKKVQLEGKNEVDFKTFNEAYKIFTP